MSKISYNFCTLNIFTSSEIVFKTLKTIRLGTSFHGHAAWKPRTLTFLSVQLRVAVVLFKTFILRMESILKKTSNNKTINHFSI